MNKISKNNLETLITNTILNSLTQKGFFIEGLIVNIHSDICCISFISDDKEVVTDIRANDFEHRKDYEMLNHWEDKMLIDKNTIILIASIMSNL